MRRLPRWPGRGLLGALAMVGAAPCTCAAGTLPEISFGLPHDASVDGWRIDWLMRITTIFIILLFAITVAWILIAVVRHGRHHRAEYDKGSAKAAIIKAVALSAVIFLVIDGNLLVSGLTDLRDAFWNFERANADPKVVRIEINAHQWAWDARYPGPDGQFNTADDIVTLNDVRIPLHTQIFLQLASTDVVHSFSLPNFRVKQDAVPGMINRMLLRARETGQFDIACAQHCGVNHYKMRGTLTVLSEADYALWAREASDISAHAFDANDPTAHWGWDWDRKSN